MVISMLAGRDRPTDRQRQLLQAISSAHGGRLVETDAGGYLRYLEIQCSSRREGETIRRALEHDLRRAGVIDEHGALTRRWR